MVEKILATEGLTRHDLGRERFAQRVWEYMDPMRWRIREQMMILGASCDWSRLAFTMDPGPSRAVRKVFKHLYDKGAIYRGSRLISWCPRCMTALSDLEVVHKDVQGIFGNLRIRSKETPIGRSLWRPPDQRRCWETRRSLCIPTMTATAT